MPLPLPEAAWINPVLRVVKIIDRFRQSFGPRMRQNLKTQFLLFTVEVLRFLTLKAESSSPLIDTQENHMQNQDTSSPQ